MGRVAGARIHAMAVLRGRHADQGGSRLSRAQLVAVGVAMLLLGCGADQGGPARDGVPGAVDHRDGFVDPNAPSAPPTSGSPGRSPQETTNALPEAPDPAPAYELSPAEVYPNAKRLAAAIAQAITTYEPGQGLVDAVADLDLPPLAAEALARQATLLHHEDRWSRGRVSYAQLGGVTDTDISVMVVTEQMLGGRDGVRTETRTLDVRLTLSAGHWVFAELADVGGSDPGPVTIASPPAVRVLNHDRIQLPDSARWDILSGHTDPTLLELMARAADEFRLGVVTLHSGHPPNVFGTERLSDHTRGLAVDIHLVDGVLVIDDRTDGSTTFRFVQWLYEQPEVRQIGSPWALDGHGGRSFTDIVHQDHIHVAVHRTR